ncbi:MAG: BT4734/BF3469 family protein [Bacteroidota bacterium]
MQASNNNSQGQSNKPLLPLSSIPAYWADSINQPKLEQLSLSEVIEAIKNDSETRKRVEHIRNISDDKLRTAEKNRILPYFCFSQFEENKRLNANFISTQHFIIDVDHLNGNGPELREKLQNDPESFIIFTSPSGDGLKIVYEFSEPITDALFYRNFYSYYCELFSKKYGIETDPATKDAARACYFSSDPDIFVNEQRQQIEAVLPSENIVQPISKPILKTNKIALAIKPVDPGSRTHNLTTIIGTSMKNGISAEDTIELCLAVNSQNPEPLTDEKVKYTVTDMFKRYSKTYVEIDESDSGYTKKGKQLTNFRIIPNELLSRKVGDVTSCTVITDKGITYNNILIENSDWYNKSKLLKAIGHSDCSFFGSDPEVQLLCKYIVDQVTIRKVGTDILGMIDDCWVVDGMNIDKNGPLANVKYIPCSKGADSFQRKIGYGSTSQKDIEIFYEHVQSMNEKESTLPWLGWVFATPLKPMIMEKHGFPLLFVHGCAGAGKTSSAELFMKLCGYRIAVVSSCTMTSFAMLKLLTSTNAIPIFMDEFKKSDMREDDVDRLQRYMRKIYAGEVESRGNADQTTTDYVLSAPLAVMGEWNIVQPALRERFIAISLSQAVKTQVHMQTAFHQLKDLSLEGFMKDYIQFVLNQDIDTRYGAARRLVRIALNSLQIPPRILQNLTVMVLGLGLFRDFARLRKVKTDKIDFKPLIEKQLETITGSSTGQVKSAVDQAVEWLAIMGAKGIISSASYHRTENNDLYIAFNKIYSDLCKFLRDIPGEKPLDLDSYKKLFKDTPYISDTSKQCRWQGASEKQQRCIVIDIAKAEAAGVDLGRLAEYVL